MGSLLNHLREKGVKLIENEEVISFEKNASTVTKIITTNNAYEADEIVLATGSWGMPTARLLDIKTPVVPGRGYSVTYEDSPYKLNYPAILMEGKTAVTPMDGNKIRFGGTMEITSHKTPVRMNRVQGILNAVKSFYPEFDVPLPLIEKVWYGYRPCSADGLPFLGRSSKLSNITVATGHSMLGLSLGAGTGKLVDELVNKKPTSMDLKPFRVERFQ
jgi:D-amino-acid dehydrogenase